MDALPGRPSRGERELGIDPATSVRLAALKDRADTNASVHHCDKIDARDNPVAPRRHGGYRRYASRN